MNTIKTLTIAFTGVCFSAMGSFAASPAMSNSAAGAPVPPTTNSAPANTSAPASGSGQASSAGAPRSNGPVTTNKPGFSKPGFSSEPGATQNTSANSSENPPAVNIPLNNSGGFINGTTLSTATTGGTPQPVSITNNQPNQGTPTNAPGGGLYGKNPPGK